MTAVTTRRVAVAMVAYTSGPLFQARFEICPSFQLTLIRTSEMETLLLHKQGNRAMGGYRACLTSGGVGGENKSVGVYPERLSSDAMSAATLFPLSLQPQKLAPVAWKRQWLPINPPSAFIPNTSPSPTLVSSFHQAAFRCSKHHHLGIPCCVSSLMLGT